MKPITKAVSNKEAFSNCGSIEQYLHRTTKAERGAKKNTRLRVDFLDKG